MEIRGKVAVITGAASGIGSALSTELVRRGIKGIALVDRSDTVQKVATALNELAGNGVAQAFIGDTTDPQFRTATYDTMTDRYGVPNICVPAAGITRDALCVKVDKESATVQIYPLDAFRLVTEVNLIAPIYWAIEMISRNVQDRIDRGLRRWDPEEGVQGAVIFIGSVSSRGIKGQISYSVAKAGLEGAAATLSMESIFHGVRCGVIHPGFTDTPMVRALGEDYIAKHVLPYTQLRRLIRPEEIADAICFMITNSAVTGELWADAGWHPAA